MAGGRRVSPERVRVLEGCLAAGMSPLRAARAVGARAFARAREARAPAARTRLKAVAAMTSQAAFALK